ncbi:MAG: hypothetical protein Kow00121_52180 [Elainellaceae cyanobacterium]
MRLEDIMSKEKKGNRETKKPKAPSDSKKKQKKDPKRHDGAVSRLFDSSR